MNAGKVDAPNPVDRALGELAASFDRLLEVVGADRHPLINHRILERRVAAHPLRTADTRRYTWNDITNDTSAVSTDMAPAVA